MNGVDRCDRCRFYGRETHHPEGSGTRVGGACKRYAPRAGAAPAWRGPDDGCGEFESREGGRTAAVHIDLSSLIAAIIDLKTGDADFALFGFEDEWRADIGNGGAPVMLGESVGEFTAVGLTPEAAVAALYRQVRATQTASSSGRPQADPGDPS